MKEVAFTTPQRTSHPGAAASCYFMMSDDDELHNKPAHAVPLASAHQRPQNQKEDHAGHSSERAVEGQPPRFFCRVFNTYFFLNAAFFSFLGLTGPVAEAPDVDLRRTARSRHQAKPGVPSCS
jgi:hypothetical protein